MSSGSVREFKLSSGYRNYLFILLCLLYFFDYTDRMVVSSLFPFIKKDWGLTDAQCGMFVSAVYWSILIFTFPVSILVDRWSRRKTIGLMAVVWSLATAICALASNFVQMFLARGLIGVGEAGYSPGGTAMISGLYPQEKRSLMIGIWNAFIPFGAAVGIAVGGIVAVNFGWRYAFGLVALPGLIVAILFFFVKDYKTVDLTKTVSSNGAGPTKSKMKTGDIYKEFTSTPSLIFTYLGFACAVFVTSSLMTWLPTFFHRIHGIPEDRAGVMAGSVMLLAIIGSPMGGYLTDLWSKKNPKARPLFASISIMVTLIILVIAFSFLEGTPRYIMIMVSGVTGIAFIPAASAMTQDVVHPGLRSISYALCMIFQTLLGSSTAPIAIGAISDSYGIMTAMNVLPIILVIAAVLFFLASIYYVRDLEKVEKVVLEME